MPLLHHNNYVCPKCGNDEFEEKQYLQLVPEVKKRYSEEIRLTAPVSSIRFVYVCTQCGQVQDL